MDLTEVNCAVGIELSADGEGLQLHWELGPKRQATFWPVAAVPQLIGMLLGAAQVAAGRQGQRQPARPAVERVSTPTDMQLLKPPDGSDWLLRVTFGTAVLDFALSPQHALQLQQAVAASPQATRKPGNLQ